MYSEVHTDNIAARAHAPEVAVLLRHYSELVQPGCRVAHEALMERIGERFGEDLFVLEREPRETLDYRFVAYGRELVRYTATNRLGSLLSEMREQVARFTVECCERAQATGQASYTVHRSRNTVRVSLWERFLMPTITADGRQRIVIFARPLQFHEELLLAVLENSPSGIVALRAVRSDRGELLQTLVMTANRRAEDIVGASEGSLLDSDASATLPFLGCVAIWQRCLDVLAQRRPDMVETSFTRDGQTAWLRIAIAPLGDGLVLTMTDVSDLITANRTLQSRAATLALQIGRERATRRALSDDIALREAREQELRRLAETDPLTALLNRRSFMEKAALATLACEASDEPASLVIVDLDHFKSINDSHGHAAGDAVIRAVADLLLGNVRADRDLVGRFGGEEFAILLPGAGLAIAQRKTELIREALATRELPASETLSLTVSASFGIATRNQGESLTDFIARADRALYRAKEEGRNCARVAENVAAAA